MGQRCFDLVDQDQAEVARMQAATDGGSAGKIQNFGRFFGLTVVLCASDSSRDLAAETST